MSAPTEVLPLLMGASGPIVDRNKRDIRTPGQWLRELKENADEAGDALTDSYSGANASSQFAREP